MPLPTLINPWQIAATSTQIEVAAGNDRLLLVVFVFESATAKTLDAVTFGGVAMEHVVTYRPATDVQAMHVIVYALREANIPAGLQGFVETWSDAGSQQRRYIGAFDNVDQVSPFLSLVSAGTTNGSRNPETVTLSALPVDARALAFWGNGSAGGGVTWGDGFAETLANPESGYVGSIGEKAITVAGDQPVNVTYSLTARTSLVAMGLAPSVATDPAPDPAPAPTVTASLFAHDKTTPRANLPGIAWAFYDATGLTPSTIGAAGPPQAGGTITADASGVIVLDVTGTTLTSGQTGTLAMAVGADPFVVVPTVID